MPLLLGLGLWFLIPLSTIFQLYRGGQFYWLRKRSIWRKPPTFRKSLTNCSHNVVSSTPRLQHYVIKYTDSQSHDITEILLNVTLSTISLSNYLLITSDVIFILNCRHIQKK